MQGMGVVERSMTSANAGCRGNRTTDIVPCALDRRLDGQTLRQPDGDRRRQRATGAMRVAALDPGMAPDAMPGFGREHVMYRVAGEVPTFQQHRAAAKR